MYQGHVQEKAQPLQRKSLQLPKKIRGKEGENSIQYYNDKGGAGDWGRRVL